jgi:hypothetical protein
MNAENLGKMFGELVFYVGVVIALICLIDDRKKKK